MEEITDNRPREMTFTKIFGEGGEGTPIRVGTDFAHFIETYKLEV
jgi:hypothetical protein